MTTKEKVWVVHTLIPKRDSYQVRAATSLEAWQKVQAGADGVKWLGTKSFNLDEEEMVDVVLAKSQKPV
jgi:hypothetical protein